MALDFAAARKNMVDSQVRTSDVTDVGIQEAMGAIARERFCLPGREYLAYAETLVDYAPGLHLMEPRDVSKLLQALFPVPGQTALAIAAPYAAAVMAHIGLKVSLMSPSAEVEATCRAALGDIAVRPLSGDLKMAGGEGPYDVAICEGAVSNAPQAWLDAIGIGGRLGVVERDGPVGKAVLYLRGEDGTIARREMFDSTPPMLPGFERERSFTF